MQRIKMVLRFQKLKEQGKVSWGGDEDAEYFAPFDEKGYTGMHGEYGKDELWEMFSEQ